MATHFDEYVAEFLDVPLAVIWSDLRRAVEMVAADVLAVEGPSVAALNQEQ
jgi:hypothetical protein